MQKHTRSVGTYAIHQIKRTRIIFRSDTQGWVEPMQSIKRQNQQSNMKQYTRLGSTYANYQTAKPTIENEIVHKVG